MLLRLIDVADKEDLRTSGTLLRSVIVLKACALADPDVLVADCFVSRVGDAYRI